MEGINLPSAAKLFRLLSSFPAADESGPVSDVAAVVQGKPLALLIAQGGLERHAAAMKKLVQTCREVSKEKKDLVVVLLLPEHLPADEISKEIKKMKDHEEIDVPWVSVFGLPGEAEIFAESVAPNREILVLMADIIFSVTGSLVLFGPDGKCLSTEGMKILQKFGARCWPFSEERVARVHAEDDEKVSVLQTLENLLVTPDRDFLLSSFVEKEKEAPEEVKVQVSSLEGKIVGLFFTANWCPPCTEFLPRLVKLYEKVNEGEEKVLEIVLISSDRDVHEFASYFQEMPWLALPFWDSSLRNKLTDLFGVRGIPSLVLLDGQGKTITKEGKDLVLELGARGFPFDKKAVANARKEIAAEIEALRANQTLEGLLFGGPGDVLLDAEKEKVAIRSLSELKTVGLLFIASWSSQCGEVCDLLKEVYAKANEKARAFEVITISLDKSLEDFSDQIDQVLWLHVPFGNYERREFLHFFFGKKTVPLLVLLDGSGKTLSLEGIDALRRGDILASL